tara:strand:- start:198 stop:761 length:564 start_codon:yes stop_codon:yes gene_type:complete
MEPKYKIPLNLRGSVSPEATLYVEQEDLNAAVATKLEELENRIAVLEGVEIASIETVSVAEETETSTKNVFPISGVQLPLISRPVDPNVSSKYLRSCWGITTDTIKQLSDRGFFSRTGRGHYDRKSIEKWLGGPIVKLAKSAEAARYYGVSIARVNSLAHRGKLKVVDFGLRERSNFRFDLSHEWSK